MNNKYFMLSFKQWLEVSASRPNNRLAGGLYIYNWVDTSTGNKPKIKWNQTKLSLLYKSMDESDNFSISQATDSFKGGPNKNRWMELTHLPTGTILHKIFSDQEPQITSQYSNQWLDQGYKNFLPITYPGTVGERQIENGRKLKIAEDKLKELAQFLVDNTPFEDDLSDTLQHWLSLNQ